VNTESIVQELEATRDRLNQAIAALQGHKSRDRKASDSTNQRKRHLSAAARKRISEAMKQRWAARKKAGKKQL
jgi:exonuclease VII small subunit